MATVATLRIDAAEVDRLAASLASIPPGFRDMVIPRALNDVGDQVFTLNKRVLAQITGAPVGRVAKVLKKIPASAGLPAVRIVATDEFMSLKDFKPSQRKKGVNAAPWKERRLFPDTFFGPGGHVFVRQTKKRLPVKKLWGPAIPREMMREEAAGQTTALITEKLPPRVLYWTQRLMSQAAAGHAKSVKAGFSAARSAARGVV